MPDPRRPRRPWTPRRWVAVIAGGLLVVAVIALAVVLWPTRQPAGPGDEIMRVTRSAETTTVTVSGTLAPQQQATASFAVPGRVTSVDVRVGDRVEQGQGLATVDDRDLANAVTLADAQATAARAQLQTVREADQATAAQITAARAQVTSAQAQADDARRRLADATLTAPLAGVVAAVNVQVGDQVSGTGSTAGLGSAASGLGGASNPFGSGGISFPGLSGSSAGASSGEGHVVIVVPDAWQLDATVGTADLPSLQAGQPAVVTPTGTSTSVRAVVDTVGIVASGASGSIATFPVTLRVTDAGARLFAGSNADAVVTTGTFDDVLTVPAEAVTTTNGASSVRVPAEPEPRVVPVTLGRRFGDRVEIATGLAEGDEILVPRGVVVTPPARPQYGPNGTLVSPDPTASSATR